MKRKTSAARLAKQLGISRGRGMEAVIKAQLISAILVAVKRQKITASIPRPLDMPNCLARRAAEVFRFIP